MINFITMGFAPTLAQSYAGGELPFPLYASLKLDGVRAYCKDGNVLSRKLIHIPNRFVQTVFSDLRLNNLEGELIVGKPNEHETFQRTSGAVRRFEDEPDVTLNVFDVAMVACFEDRLNYIKSLPVMPRVKVIDQVLINCNDELVAFKDKAFKDKYEGVILRRPQGIYKTGRTSLDSADFLKIKPVEDAEAIIIDIVEGNKNTNEKQFDELGHSKRSTHKDNLKPNDTLGYFVLQRADGGVFNCGGGRFNHKQRKHIFDNKHLYIGKTLKYSFLNHGMKPDEKGRLVPRQPIALGFRDSFDC